MWREREAMATTSFVAVRDMENGFEGRGMIAGIESASVFTRCTCSVESHDADMTMLCSLL